MNAEHRRAIADAVARITATTVVEGEASDNLIGSIAARVADLAAPTNPIASEVPDAMVQRFLSWSLPGSFSSDAGVDFKLPNHMAS